MANQKLQLQKHLVYLDVFRFTIKKDECNNILTKLSESVLGDVSQQDNSININNNRNNSYTIPCLEIAPRLIDNQILEPNEDDGWTKLQQILFERSMIEDYESFQIVNLDIPKKVAHILITTPDASEISTCNDSQILRYLYGCYYRLQIHIQLNDLKTNVSEKEELSALLTNINSVIVDLVSLYLSEPALFPDREKRMKQDASPPLLLNLVIRFHDTDPSHKEATQNFVNEIGKACAKLGDAALESVLDPTYNRLCQKFSKLHMNDKDIISSYDAAIIFVQCPEFAEKFVQKITLKKDSSIAYQSTLLGYMLCVSNLPRPSQMNPQFFQPGMSESERRAIESMLGIQLDNIGKELHRVFHNLLKAPKIRTPFLNWLGRCLYTFKDRKKLWSNQVLMQTTTISVNDGLLMNLLTTMLRLSEPFAGPFNEERFDQNTGGYTMNKRMLKIDPRYCKWSTTSPETSKTNLLGLAEETFLVQLDGDKKRDSIDLSGPYEPNFISECFFATHLAFSYGFRSVYERFFKLTQNLNELQQTYNDMMSQPVSPMNGPDPREMVKHKIDQAMSTFMNLKTILMEPNRVKMQLHFIVATASYLNHLATCQTYEDALNSAESTKITFQDLKEKRLSRVCFEFIPEMLIENILDFMLFAFLFYEEIRNDIEPMLEPIMTFIIIFMGNSKLMQNPHLRARFAEVLEYIKPHLSGLTRATIGRDEIFQKHHLIRELIPSLVNVFVGIEMTGEGVQFEQKFSYRRPMYVVLKFLWGYPIHRAVLIGLALDAERNIESARPPLLLRFINLLINDAIFLLDEALNYMNQLKEAEQRKRSEEWPRLSPQQRQQAEATYTHIGRLARFHNVLSLYTIGTLAWMTTEIKTIFCHPTLVDRIANMLNYFLENLVGDKRKNFNVNDKVDYDFKPKVILERICTIYVNLGLDNNPRFTQFCTAVSSDGRSYNENLLPKAIEIMYRTGMTGLATEFEKLSKQVHKIAVQNQLDEIPSEDIPDTFLDPIMSTLMQDPVLLPSSKIIVDRSTIARHLLSDQTDPFNRSPLSMEDVIPQEDLKNQITTFLRDRRAAQIQLRSNNKF